MRTPIDKMACVGVVMAVCHSFGQELRLTAVISDRFSGAGSVFCSNSGSFKCKLRRDKALSKFACVS